MKNKKFKFFLLITGAALAKPTYSYLKSLWDQPPQITESPAIAHFIELHQDSIEALSETLSKFSSLSEKKLKRNQKKLESLCEKIRSLKLKQKEIREKESICFDIPDYLSEFSEIQENTSVELGEISCSSMMIEDESKIHEKKNKLLRVYNPNIKSSLRLQFLIKSIENILSNKFKDDISALDKNKDPLRMPDYLYNFLYKESPVLVEKKVSEYLNAFKEHQKDPRIRFYCRLFQVFDPSPISYKLSLYLIKMRHFFNIFISKQVIPESLKKRVDKMQVIVIMKSARKLFNSDIETGKIVLKNLKPDSMPNLVWTITCIEYYLYYKNLLPIDCFKAMTKETSLTEKEFIDGLTSVHQTFINQSDLQQLFGHMSNGLMPIEDFCKMFDLDSFFKRNQTYLVEQIQFLNSLIEGYSSMRLRHSKQIENLISETSKKVLLLKEEANLVLQKLSPGLSLEKIYNGTEISVRELKRKILELNIGGMGIGCYNLRSIERISDIFEE